MWWRNETGGPGALAVAFVVVRGQLEVVTSQKDHSTVHAQATASTFCLIFFSRRVPLCPGRSPTTRGDKPFLCMCLQLKARVTMQARIAKVVE